MTLRTKRLPYLVGFTTAGAAVLLLLGACAPIATDAADGEYVLIPSSTNRPSDPPPVTAEPGDPDGVAPEDAPMAQLWALADSEVGDSASDSGSGPGVGLADFSAAVAARCYPELADADKTELDGLKAAYESQAGAGEPAHAYFVRATELCM
jgi:hypothetical protein